MQELNRVYIDASGVFGNSAAIVIDKIESLREMSHPSVLPPLQWPSQTMSCECDSKSFLYLNLATPLAIVTVCRQL